ncbi:hypothetical protein J6590_017731 [Homalodisca vitripennis]|nr:hypothetical protein J6590_104196 [Homalodisca vitripennis]KAG8337636.1 hypothetical protein J6590_017731 [Homalodisca vitripennis]
MEHNAEFPRIYKLQLETLFAVIVLNLQELRTGRERAIEYQLCRYSISLQQQVSLAVSDITGSMVVKETEIGHEP